MADDGIGHRFRIGFFEAFFIEVGRAPTIFKGSIDGFFDDRLPLLLRQKSNGAAWLPTRWWHRDWQCLYLQYPRRAVDRFIETGQFANGRRRHHTDGTAEDRRFVTQDIAEEVSRNDNVELFRIEASCMAQLST